MNIKRVDKFENGDKIGEVYRITLMANKCADGTINIDVYDGSEVDWREITDCATYDVREIEIPVR